MENDMFERFASLTRFSHGWTVTEKIDGTNALVSIDEAGVVRAGSRSRWITPEADNFGFAAWVAKHADELRARLGIEMPPNLREIRKKLRDQKKAEKAAREAKA